MQIDQMLSYKEAAALLGAMAGTNTPFDLGPPQHRGDMHLYRGPFCDGYKLTITLDLSDDYDVELRDRLVDHPLFYSQNDEVSVYKSDYGVIVDVEFYLPEQHDPEFHPVVKQLLASPNKKVRLLGFTLLGETAKATA